MNSTANKLFYKIENLLTPKRLRIYPQIFLVVSWGIIILNFITHDGWRGGFGQIIGTDFITLYSAGWLYRTNINFLYDISIQSEIQQALILPTPVEGVNPFISSPYVAMMYSFFTFLPLIPSFILWSIISLLCVIIAVRLLLELMPPKLTKAHPQYWYWLIIFLSFFPLVQGWQVGQNHTLTLLLLTGVFYFSLRGHPYLAGVSAGFMIYKPQFVIGFVLLWIVWRNWKSLLSFLIVSLIWIGFSILQHGFEPYLDYLEFNQVIQLLPYISGFPGYLLITPYGLLATLLPPPIQPVLIWLVIIVFLVLSSLLVWLAYRMRDMPISKQYPLLIFACLLPILATPYVLFHDLLILAPILIIWSWFGNKRFLVLTTLLLYFGGLIFPAVAFSSQIAIMAVFPIIFIIGFLHWDFDVQTKSLITNPLQAKPQ